MKRVLIKIKDKQTLFDLKQFGDVETVSGIFNIYAMSLDDLMISKVKGLRGIVTIEDEEYFEVQDKDLCLT